MTLSPFLPSVVPNTYNIIKNEMFLPYFIITFITMPSTKYLKAKERLTLVLYIKNLNKEANPCLYYY